MSEHAGERGPRLSEVGYKVEPTRNGGFIVMQAPEFQGSMSPSYAFTDARDLLHFLSQEHGVVGLDLTTGADQTNPHSPQEGEALPDSPTDETITKAAQSMEEEAAAAFDQFSRSAWSDPATAARANGSAEQTE